jgi:hypothetical protein
MCQAFKKNWNAGLDEPTNHIFESMGRYYDKDSLEMYRKEGIPQLVIAYSEFFSQSP